jgi:hypothetical protein
MKLMELNKMGLSPVTDFEMREINGGGIMKWLRRITVLGVAKEIIDHWEEVKKGFSNGWNFDKSR